ncbi:hypothetical protein GCK72_025420 [Caenorhabditis remanei]|uniref:Uncharacterized protein n=1 Tax=Caenorhabditis remanei TaxID=31234 RepID=A0A6A5G2C9_CAERE|nr:hypothetical protein GCK72_025420 [Caenorhabditis remanei]KAF1748953.1 hypothetical protein GCK72_025420 [Caenorhabditis remanei]
MPTSEQYRAFLWWFYPNFLGLSLMSQTFVIYVIVYHTPKNLQRLKAILINTCFFQVIHVTVCFVMQFRQVSSYTPMEIWSYGIGRHLEAYIGYSLYHVMQTATFVSGISVVITLFLKYEAARVVKLKQTTRVLIITGILTPLFISITMEIILVTTQALPSQIRERYVMINANNTDHAVIGILSFDVLASQVNAITMSISVVLFPVVGSTSRSKILKHIRNTSDRVSAAKNAQNKIFVQAATLFSSVITFLTIYLKYEAASSFKQAKTLRVIVIILLFAPIIILSGAEAYLIITNALPAEIQEKFSTINIDSSDHSVIGYITLKTYSSVIIFVILCCSVFILPPIGFFVRRKILNVVTSNIDRNSSLKKSQSRSFINGLTLQAFLPLICYTPMFIYLFVILVTKSEMLFEQYFIGVFTILPTLCDSFITMYSVTPYRKQIRTWLGMEKTEQMVMVAPHSQMF